MGGEQFEGVQGGAQVGAGVGAAAFAAQPFAVQQGGAGLFEGAAGALVQAECVQVGGLGEFVRAEQGLAAQPQGLRPGLPGGGGPAGETLVRLGGAVRGAEADGGLDQVGDGAGGGDVVAVRAGGEVLEAVGGVGGPTLAEVVQGQRPVRPGLAGGRGAAGAGAGPGEGGRRQGGAGVGGAGECGQVGQQGVELAHPLALSGVLGECAGLGGGDLGVAVAAVEEFGLGEEELQRGQDADGALGAGLGGEFGGELVGLAVASEDQGRAAELDEVARPGPGAAGLGGALPGGGQRRRGAAQQRQRAGQQVAGERRGEVLGRQPECCQPVEDGADGLLADVPGGVEGLEEHPGGVRRLDVGGGGGQQQAVGGGVVAAPEVRGGVDVGDQRVREGAVGAGAGPVGEGFGALQLPFLGGCFGGEHEPPGGVVAIGAEPGRPLVRGGGAAVAAARAGPFGGALQGVGEGGVGRGGGEGEVPAAAVAVLQRLAERPVYGQPLLQGRPLEDRGAQQRMPEGGCAAVREVDQAEPFGGCELFGPGAEGGGGPQDGREVAGLLGGGHEQERLGGRREPGHLSVEGELEAAGERQAAGRARARGLGGERGGEFGQGERVAPRLGQYAVAQGGRYVGRAGGEQLGGGGLREPGEP